MNEEESGGANTTVVEEQQKVPISNVPLGEIPNTGGLVEGVETEVAIITAMRQQLVAVEEVQ